MAEESPEDHISRIRADCGVAHDGTIVQNRIFGICERSLSTLSTELNKDPAHFLLEIIQNADDLKYAQGVEPLLSFQVLEDHLLITSNETGFTPNDVNAICSVAESTKTDSIDTTGEKGIGFKSIFKAATRVWVSSNGYKFKFDKDEPCGIVIPAWAPFPMEFAHLVQPQTTQFLLQFNKPSCAEKVVEELRCFDPKLLIFLRKLREIDILIDGKQEHIQRHDSEKYNGLSISLSTTSTHGKSAFYEFICTRKQIPVTIQDSKRKGRLHTEVAVAFPIQSGPMCDMRISIDGAGQAYNFLPICKTNFPFLFQADFILCSTREDVDNAHREWNTMLLKGLAKAFSDAVERFNQTDELRYKWISYLPLSPGHDSFAELSHYIKAELTDKEILVSSTNQKTLLKARNACFVPAKLRDHNEQPLFNNISNISVSYMGIEGLTWLGVVKLSMAKFLKLFKIRMASHDGELEFRSRPLEWHLKLAIALLEVDVDELRDMALIPLRNGQWSANSKEYKVYFSLSDTTGNSLESIPLGLDTVRIVRDGMALPQNPIYMLFAKLGVQTLGVREICDVICNLHTSYKTPPSQDMPTLISHAKYLFDAYKAQKHLEILKNLWVCNADQKPCVGGMMYQSKIQVGEAVKKFVIGTTSESNFMHPAYMSSLPEADHQAWSKWLFSHADIYTDLRIKLPWGNPTPTPEFSQCMDITMPQEFLEILVNIWPMNSKSSLVDALSFPFIRSMSRPWAGKDCIRLDQTVLPLPALMERAPNGLSFIDLRKPEDKEWHRLEDFGVITTKDHRFWLHCLDSCINETDNSVSTNSVKEIYLGLDQHFLKDPSTIKSFFAQYNAILICPNNKPMWVKASDCLWSSTVQNLRTKQVIAPLYTDKKLENFFKTSLGIDDLDSQTLVDELKAFSHSRNEEQDHTYLLGILKALNSIPKQAKPSIREALKQLRSKEIIPLVKVIQDGARTYTRVSMETNRLTWYIPDSAVYKEAFQEQLWLFDIEPEEAKEMEGLITAISRYSDKPRYLSHEVVEKDDFSGEVKACPHATDLLHKRSNAIACVSKACISQKSDQTQSKLKPGLEVKYKKLETAKVFTTSWIRKSLTIKRRTNFGIITIEGKPTSNKVMLQDSKAGLQIYILYEHAKLSSGLHSGVSDELINWLEIKKAKNQRLLDKVLAADNHNEIRDLLIAAGINVKDLVKPHEDVRKVVHRPASTIRGGGVDVVPAVQEQLVAKNPEFGKAKPNRQQNYGVARKIWPEKLAAGRKAFLLKAPLNQLKRSAFGSISSGTSQSSTGTTAQRRGIAIAPDFLNRPVHTFKIDPKSGLEGEFLVYNKLKFVLGQSSSFTYNNWTSEIRHLADSSIPLWHAPDDMTFFADFTYQDKFSKLGRWLNDNYPSGTFSKAWSTKTDLTYHIEVKATFGASNEPFHISCRQLTEALRKSPGRSSKDVYLLFRVSKLQDKKPCLDVFDVYSCILDGTMLMGGEGLILQPQL